MGMANEAAYVKAPLASGVIQLDISASGGRFEIPAAFAGCQCTFEVFGDSEAEIAADILFGGASVSVTYSQDATVNSEVITVNAATGMKLVSGAPKHWVMPLSFGPNSATHFYVDASADGKLKIAKS